MADGKAFIAGCDSILHAVDVKTHKEVWYADMENYATGASTIADGKVIVGHHSGRIMAVNLKDGSSAWDYPEVATEFPFYASVAVHNGIVVAGGQDKTAHGISLKDGKKLWTFRTKGDIDGEPLIAGNRVYFGSRDGTLYGLDLKTGEKKWEYVSGRAISAPPAYHNGKMYIGNMDGTLFCFGPEKNEEDSAK